MPPATLLHVVYAGRGDALAVQDGDKLYLIDGGPFGNIPKDRGGGPQWRLYHNALLEIAAEMGRPAVPLKPDGVVVSHGHDDHYGGISGMFTQFLSKTKATGPNGNKTLVFNGPLVTQVLSNPDDPNARSLAAMIRRFSFGPVAKPRTDQPLFEAFTFAGNPEFSTYERDGSVLPARVWSVDVSADNLASVLMFHDATKMVFTGDSAGYLVAAFLEDQDELEDETLPIFKVPHHGSLRNSQRGQLLGTVPTFAWRQYALLCLGSPPSEWHAIEMPKDLRDAGAVAAAHKPLEQACEREGIDVDDLVDQLRGCFDLTLLGIADEEEDPFIPAPFSEQAIGRIWLDVVASLQALQAGAAPAPGSKKRKAGDTIAASWVAALTPTQFSDVYYGLLAFKQLTSFFADFKARNHVISANGKYLHPSAETLAGIAAAANQSDEPVRVLVTNGFAVDFSRVAQLAPGWEDYIELRYLARGQRMILDPAQPDAIGALDPERTTANLMPVVTITQVLAQLQRDNGARIEARVDRAQKVKVEVEDQGNFLNLGPNGEISITFVDQSLLIDQAWLLRDIDISTVPYPGTFDDIRVTIADGADWGVSRLITVVEPGDGNTYLSVEGLFQQRAYLCSDPATNYLTPNLAEADPFCFVVLGAAADGARAEESTVPLVEFCRAVGVPTDKPLSGEKLLPQLVGPATAGVLEKQVLSQLIQRALGWNADLDASKVTYRVDEYGPLVTAAEVVLELGDQRDFTVDEQAETIAGAALSVERPPGSGAVDATGSVNSAAGTRVSDSATDPHPRRSQPLDQYLFALGVPESKRPDVTAGTLLTAMVGSALEAAELLLAAPSPIVLAGIGEWRLDHEVSSVESQRTLTGGYVEVREARLALQAPAGISETVEGMTLAFSEIALTVSYGRLPTMEVALEATATVGGTPLAARSLLSDGDCATRLSLPGGSGLTELIDLLPADAGGLAALEVPLAGKPLGALTLTSPAIEVRQPSVGAEPYELTAAGGTIDLPGWQQALPTGWPAPPAGVVTVEVLDPADPDHRRLALAAAFATPIDGAEAGTVLRMEPSGSAWSQAVSLDLDPATQPRTAAQVLGAVGLSGPLSSLSAELRSLEPLLDRLAVEQLTFTPPPGGAGAEEGCVEMSLIAMSGWKLLPGVVDLRLAQVALTWEGGLWSARVEGEGSIGPLRAVAVSADLATPDLGGAISFENAGAELTVTALADLCGLGSLGQVPILGAMTGKPVTQVELVPAIGLESSLAAAGFNLAIDPVEAGVLDLTWGSMEVARTLLGPDAVTAQSTAFWLEARWGKDLVASLFYDDAAQPERLLGTLRPIAAVALGDALRRLLEETAESTLLPAVAKLPMAGGALVQRSADFGLLSCEVALKRAAGLPVAAATASGLKARWVGAHKEGDEEVPEAYLLDGRLSREGYEHEASIEIGFRGDDKTKTARGTIGPVPPEAGKEEEELTAAILLELLGLEKPQVPTPKGAPEFFDRKITSATATFSVEPFRLEALTIVVKTGERLPLLPAPGPIDLFDLTMQIDYGREAKPTTSGFVSGDLKLEPKPVTLVYTEPENEDAAFRATVTLKAEEAPDYRKLIAAEPYDPGYPLPGGLGIPAAIPMTALDAVAKPEEYVLLRGHDERTTWPARLDRLEMEVGDLGGQVRVARAATPGGPHRFELSLFGRLAYRGFVGADGRFTWGPGETHSVLTASATENPEGIDLPAIAEALAAPWGELVPAGTPSFGFAAAWTCADFTADSLDLYGNGSLGSVAGEGALLSAPEAGARHSAFLFGARATGSFPLAPLWPELGALVDDYLSLAKGNLAVLSNPEPGAKVDADRAAIAADAERQSVQYTPPFTSLPALEGELPSGTELRRGLSVVAAVDASGSGELSQALSRIADPAAALPLLIAWGPVDHTAPRLSAFQVKLTGLVLLGGGVTVEAVADYRPSESQALVAAATARAPVGTAKPYPFHGRLRIGVEEASFDSDEPATDDPIAEPLGLTGLALHTPRLTATYRYPPGQSTTSNLRVTGTVELTASGEKRSPKGAIEYLAGAPVVAVFTMEAALTTADVYANRMSGGTWPAGYPSFAIESPRVYAAPADVTVGGYPYLAGYHAVGNARFLGHGFALDTAIEPAGLRASASSDAAIDLVYLVLSAPAVSIDTTGSTTVYELSGAAAVFKASFGQLRLAYEPTASDGAGWYGEATHAGKVVGVIDPTVGFVYREGDEEGLRLREWPLRPSFDKEQFDWEEALEEASEGTECKQLEDLGLDDGENEEKKITTSFDLHMRQTGEVAADALPVLLSGTYTVVVSSEDSRTETKMQFPETPCEIQGASGFRLDQLEGWVDETVKARQEALGRSLLEEDDVSDGERGLKKFMSEFDLGEASDQLLERLLCNEDDSENVKEEVEERVEETVTKTRKEWEKAKEESGASESSKTISGAGGGAAGGGGAIATAIGWLIPIGGLGFLGGLFGMARGWLPIVLVEEWEELVEEEREEAEAAVTEATKRVEDELLPMHGAPKVEFTAPDAVAVSWDEANLPNHPGIDYEGFKDVVFEVEVSTDPGFAEVVGTATVPGTARTATVTAEPLARSNNGYARARAVLFPLSPIPGTWTAPVSGFHLVRLPAPASVSQRLDAHGDQIVVTVATVPDARSYLVELRDTVSGTTLATKSVTSPTPSPASVGTNFEPDDLPPQPPGQPPLRLLARAQAVGDPAFYEDSPSTSAPEAEAVATTGPPKVNAPVLVTDGVQVTWEQVDDAGAYPVRVLDALGNPLPQQPEVTPTGLGCLLSGPGIVEGASLRVEVRALAQTALGPWCLPVPFTVRVLPAPDALRALYLSPENAIEARWEAVGLATTYEVGVDDGGGKPLAPTIVVDGSSATISGACIAPDRSYRLRVRAVGPGYVSTWGAWLPLSTAVAPTPSQLSLKYGGGSLMATWTAVAGASGYRAALDRDGNRIAGAEVAASPAVFGTATGTRLAPSTAYTVAVRARVGSSVGPPATAGTTTPSLLEIAIASWAAALPVETPALECLALEQGLGPAQLWDTLLGAGYTASEASAGVLAALPRTTRAQLEAIGLAVGDRPQAIGLLVTEKVEGPVIVGLCRALYSPVPVQLAVLLKAEGVSSAGLAAAFARWFPMSLPEAEAMIAAVYSEPWRFGPVAKTERLSANDAVSLLKTASPGAPEAAILAALKAAPYTEAELRQAFGTQPPFPPAWPAWYATHQEAAGKQLAFDLKSGGTSRDAASHYVPTCWPQLTPAEVKRDIDNAYGPQ